MQNLLGEVDNTKDIKTLQNDGMSFTGDHNNVNENVDEETMNASTKVKVTHLELPFGKDDTNSALEALKVMRKISKGDKSKVKIEKNPKGAGFTLSGLPPTLNTAEVTKIAKGVASVIEESSGEEPVKNKAEASKHPSKGDSESMNVHMSGDLEAGSSSSSSSSSGVEQALNLLKLPGTHHHGGSSSPGIGLYGMNTNINPMSAGIGEAGSSQGVGGSSLNGDINGDLAGGLSNSAGVGLPADAGSVPMLNQHPVATEPEIESVSVVGNLAAAHMARLKGGGGGGLGHIAEHAKPHLGTVNVNHPCSKVCTNFALIPLHHPCHKLCSFKNSGSLDGDSIGTPISDMLPGLPYGDAPASLTTGNANGAGIPIGNEDDSESTVTGVAQTNNGLTDLPVSVAGSLSPPNTGELTINRLTDYDVLDVDLEGINSLKNIGALNQEMGLGNRLFGQKLADSDVPTGLEGTTCFELDL